MNRRLFLGKAMAAPAAMVFLSIGRGKSAATAADHRVEIADFVFSPAHLSVRPGDSITFVNLDIVPHTATASDGSWDTGELGSKESRTLIVTDDFHQAYFCAFHLSMIGELRLR